MECARGISYDPYHLFLSPKFETIKILDYSFPVLHGTSRVALKEKQELKTFENRIVRKMFGPMRR
jgi:hypothetical protein